MRFGYDAAVLERFPAIRGGVLHATGLANGPAPEALLAASRDEQRAAAARMDGAGPASLPSIVAWRRAFAEFGAKPTQVRSAAEALLRRLDKHGEIPSINALVDLGNLVSIRYAMPVAVVDLAGIAGAITVRFAAGDEPFTGLGADEAVAPEPGEVVFVDEDGVACARRWCWRQSAQSATRASTVEALVVVEGLHPEAERDVEAAVRDLTALLAEHQPGSAVESYVLSPAGRASSFQ